MFMSHQLPTQNGNLRVTFDSSLSLEPQYPDSCCVLWIYLHVFPVLPPSGGAFTHVMTLMFNQARRVGAGITDRKLSQEGVVRSVG